MNFLVSMFVSVGLWLLSKVGRVVLTSLGIGIISATISLSVFREYIAYLQNQYSALGEIAGIFALAGVDYGLSIIITAVVVKISLSASKVSLGRLK